MPKEYKSKDHPEIEALKNYQHRNELSSDKYGRRADNGPPGEYNNIQRVGHFVGYAAASLFSTPFSAIRAAGQLSTPIPYCVDSASRTYHLITSFIENAQIGSETIELQYKGKEKPLEPKIVPNALNEILKEIESICSVLKDSHNKKKHPFQTTIIRASMSLFELLLNEDEENKNKTLLLTYKDRIQTLVTQCPQETAGFPRTLASANNDNVIAIKNEMPYIASDAIGLTTR